MKTTSFLVGLVLLVVTSGHLYAKAASIKNTDENNTVPVNRTIAKANGLKVATGVYVINASVASNGVQLALHSGDIILAVNGHDVMRPAEVTATRIAKEPDDVVNYKIWRDKKVHFLNLRKPSLTNLENSAQFDILYDEVSFRMGSIRCIVTKPKGIKKAPAILLMQGGTSGSVCNVPEDNIYRKLTDNLTQKGYVTMRVEMVGVGENMDQMNSNNTDIYMETLAFEKALQKLKKYGFVDSSKTFVFGHCTGGKISTLLAARNSVKGVVVYGSCLNPASEYLNKMLWSKIMNRGMLMLRQKK